MPNLHEAAALAQIISLVVSLITILVTVWLHYRSRQRKALAVQFHSVVSPIEIKAGEAFEGDIGISYKGQTVRNLFLVRATLKNIGDQPILRSDVVDRVRFTFGPHTELLREPQVVHKEPENLQIGWFWPTKADTKPNAVELIFDLLNQDDELTAEFMCTGKSTIPKVTARIKGIRKIELLDPEKMRLRKELMDSLWKATATIVGICLCIFILARINAVLDIIEPFFTRLANDSSFRLGVGWGLLIALFVGWVSRQLLYYWNRVLQLSKPTRKLATSPSPSPLQIFVQAILSLAVLAVIIIFALLIAARYLGLI